MADWEEVTDPAEAKKVLGVEAFNRLSKGPGGGAKMSPQAQKFLNDLSTAAQGARETGKIYDEAGKAVSTLQPGPNRGRFLEIATPEEGGGILDTLGAIVVGAPARAIGAITPEETNAYQTLRALQSSNVLTRQIEQKGPQTESDAARLMLTELSPSKSEAVNKEIVERGRHKTRREQAKAIFYTRFANKWGLNGTSPHGHTADELWAKQGDAITRQLFEGKPILKQQPTGTSRIRVISRTKAK